MIDSPTAFDAMMALLGFLNGLIGVVFGASMFLSYPLFMHLFPEATIGQIIGNIKLGSLLRNLGSTVKTWRNVNIIEGLHFSWPFIIGSILGAYMISDLSKYWLLPMILIAIGVTEFADRITKLEIPAEVYLLAAFGSGVYAGFLGIGISVLLIALFRLQYPQNEKIAWIKIQSLFVEFLILVATISTHLINKNIRFEMWFFWGLGGLLGGFAGAALLSRMQGWAARNQKVVLRASYVFALLAAGVSVIVFLKDLR